MCSKKAYWLLIVLLTAACFVPAVACRASDQDEAAVRKATAQFYTALNAMLKGDPAPANEVWSHANDVTYMGADGGFRVGWDQVYVDWAVQADLKVGGTAKPSDIRITVGTDMAVVHNYVNTERRTEKGQRQKALLRATSVFRTLVA